jgi:U4/U6 small nuclear ribonucleoprotein PRP3
MRVLRAEVVEDPTKVEAHTREQMAKRQKANKKANAARRLTADHRTEKRVRKLKIGHNIICQYSCEQGKGIVKCIQKFKVEANAKQQCSII